MEEGSQLDSDLVFDERSHHVIEDREIVYDDQDPTNILGKGKFGVVWKGVCRGMKVAVKVPSEKLSADKVEEFRSELRVMCRISHPLVVSLLGAYLPEDLTKERVKIVMERAGVDLETYLSDPKNECTLYERLKWYLMVAEGMAWIHGAGVVHRDLKPSNCMLDREKRQVKVCDFGLSLLLPPGSTKQAGAKGTPAYVAPELAKRQPTSHLCDVFSFAIMGYFFVTRQSPYVDREEYEYWSVSDFLTLIAYKNMRPWQHESAEYGFPPEHVCPTSLQLLLTQCWDNEPRNRLSFVQIIDQLQPILVDAAVPCSVAARGLWKDHFVLQGVEEEVSWDRFYGAMWLEFAPGQRSDEEDVLWYKCVKQLFAEQDSVHIERFGRIISFLPHLKRGRDWFDALDALLHQPWFFGDFSSMQAYKALLPAPKGSFIIRFSRHAPFFALSFRSGDTVLHKRILKEWESDTVIFELGDAKHPYPNVFTLVQSFDAMMKPLEGSPFDWIHKGTGAEDGGYYKQAVPLLEQEEESSSEDLGNTQRTQNLRLLSKMHLQKLKPADVVPGLSLRYLGRTGTIVQVDELHHTASVLFADNNQTVCLRLSSLIKKAYN